MSTPRFVLAVALSAALLLVAAACGGKSTRAKAPTVPTTSSAATPAAQRAQVNSVTLAGPSKATVVYTIYLGGKPALAHQKGTAVKIGGKWKVGLASFCKLLRLQGAPPAACAQAR